MRKRLSITAYTALVLTILHFQMATNVLELIHALMEEHALMESVVLHADASQDLAATDARLILVRSQSL